MVNNLVSYVLFIKFVSLRVWPSPDCGLTEGTAVLVILVFKAQSGRNSINVYRL